MEILLGPPLLRNNYEFFICHIKTSMTEWNYLIIITRGYVNFNYFFYYIWDRYIEPNANIILTVFRSANEYNTLKLLQLLQSCHINKEDI